MVDNTNMMYIFWEGQGKEIESGIFYVAVLKRDVYVVNNYSKMRSFPSDRLWGPDRTSMIGRQSVAASSHLSAGKSGEGIPVVGTRLGCAEM